MPKTPGGWKGQRGTRQERGYGAAWDRLRKAFIKAEPLCRSCAAKGRTHPADEVDHIIPKANGGTDEWDNLQPLCRECHAEKSSAEGHAGKSPEAKRNAYGIPQGMKPSAVPVILIAGPPGSGKTTHAHAIARQGDTIIDLDDIVERICGHRWTSDIPTVGKALAERDAILCGLHAKRGNRVILIVTGKTPDERTAWMQALGQRARLHVMQTGAAECIRRIKADPARAHSAARQIEAVKAWR
jgi:5-methylcytosine-specific restriction protein A